MRFSSLPFPGRRRAAAALLALGLLAACGQEGTTVGSSGSAAAGTGGGGGSGGEGGSDLPPVPVTIVDWNTHNFFDTLDDNPAGDVLTKAQYTKKRQTIGAELAKLAATVHLSPDAFRARYAYVTDTEPAALSVLSRMPPPQRFSEVPSPPRPASE